MRSVLVAFSILTEHQLFFFHDDFEIVRPSLVVPTATGNPNFDDAGGIWVDLLQVL